MTEGELGGGVYKIACKPLIFFLFFVLGNLSDSEDGLATMANHCAIYLHKIWLVDPQLFAATLALNPRTQRKFVWAITQMLRYKLPSDSCIAKEGMYF